MWVGLLTDKINNKLEESHLINKHALDREPVPLKQLLQSGHKKTSTCERYGTAAKMSSATDRTN